MNLSVFFRGASQLTLRLYKSVLDTLRAKRGAQSTQRKGLRSSKADWVVQHSALTYLDCSSLDSIIKERKITVVEPLLSGIVLGLIPVTLIGLFVAAYMQYRRGDQLGG